jgi:hypothetical protein
VEISDELLYAAAPQARELLLGSLPGREECEHRFSARFDRRMRTLLLVQKYGHGRMIARRAAAAILAILILMGSWLTVDTKARAALIQWVREWYTEHISYRFTEEPKDENLPQYSIGALPKGYMETDRDTKPGYAGFYYENAEGQKIYFYYERMEQGTLISIDTTDMVVEEVSVNGFPGEVYLSQNPTQSNCIIWMDTENDICFCIDSHLDKSALLHMAESIILSNQTK